MNKIKCPYNCKCTRKIKNYCCAPKGFKCTQKKGSSLNEKEN